MKNFLDDTNVNLLNSKNDAVVLLRLFQSVA